MGNRVPPHAVGLLAIAACLSVAPPLSAQYVLIARNASPCTLLVETRTPLQAAMGVDGTRRRLGPSEYWLYQSARQFGFARIAVDHGALLTMPDEGGVEVRLDGRCAPEMTHFDIAVRRRQFEVELSRIQGSIGIGRFSFAAPRWLPVGHLGKAESARRAELRYYLSSLRPAAPSGVAPDEGPESTQRTR